MKRKTNKSSWISLLLLLYFFSCQGEEDADSRLQVTTLGAAGITSTEAACKGRIVGKKENISAYGIELIHGNDTVAHRRTNNLSGDEFIFKIPELIPATSYQFRAFADDGTMHYGDIMSFTTAQPKIIASHIPLADPFILYHEGIYYAYGTNSDDGIPVYTSRDLTLWKRRPTLALAKENSYGDRWFWAPEVCYRPENKTFYLFYSAEEHICAATSNSPLGPFKQALQQPMREEKSIDNTLFIDDDGKPYLFFVRFTNGNAIWSAELENDWLSVRENTLKMCVEAVSGWERIQAKVAEGPSVTKQNGLYYLLYSANDYQSKDYAVGYAAASSLTDSWKKAPENPILHKPNEELAGTGHGAMFKDKDGNLRYVFHAHYDPTTIHPRKMYITNLAIDNNGKISMDKDNIIYPIEYE
ncbi:MAG: glycoside hydrolase family 43 protein [Dysgonamonadaceae bacterium]|jgi:beta-xylosidase|nr:glycoside hydrolase family 43 protein [Dysgonamonadaceae bacterium]